MRAKLLQSCLTLCDPMDYSPPGSSVHRDSPGKNTGVGCCAFLQGIFPAQGLNPDLPLCRQILSNLRHQGSPSEYKVITHSASVCICLMTMLGWKKHKLETRLQGRNINNLRYADDTTLMAKTEEELKCLLMRVKE